MTRHRIPLPFSPPRISLPAFLLVAAVSLAPGCGRDAAPPSGPVPHPPVSDLPPAAPPGLVWVNPTPQNQLAETNSTAVYMPTASGRVESAHYGSTRTADRGGGLRASFHEGIDIGPTQRGRNRVALDDIFAAADGRVAHINRVAGNSSYGIYVVLTHDDPIGEVYSLYAHLAQVAPGLKTGQNVQAGTVLGRMGNTATYAIPMERAHLHFEIGLIASRRFPEWFRSKKLKPDHGLYNGTNLMGISPLSILLHRSEGGHASVADALGREPAAFELWLPPGRKPPEYYRRYPSLADQPLTGALGYVMAVSEGGVPLRLRDAVAEEPPASKTPTVLRVDEEVLGRNGRYLIRRDRGQWVLSGNGVQWLEILQY